MESDEPKLENFAVHKKLILILSVRLTFYYVFLLAFATTLVYAFPGMINDLPIGGMSQLYGAESVTQLEEAFLSADDEEVETVAEQLRQAQRDTSLPWVDDALSLFYAMSSTVLLMIPVSWVYKTIHRDSIYDHSLDETTLVLPTVVAGIVTVVQHSLALAFSLAGIVAGVRFRRALSDTFDTLFILASIGVGIAAGIRSIETAIVLTVFFNYLTIGVYFFSDGLESQYALRRKQEKVREKELRRLSE